MQFYNKKFGLCVLNLIERQEEVVRVIRHSMDNAFFDHYAREGLERFFAGVKSQQLHYYFYEICTSKGLSLGFTGFNSNHLDESACPEVFIYVALPYQQQGIATDCSEVLISSIFKKVDCNRVLTNYYFYSNELVSTLKKFGFDDNQSRQLCLTKEDRGLCKLSAIIRKEGMHMLPTDTRLAKDLPDRVGKLWYTYFSEGIPLSTGGVEQSFIDIKDMYANPNLQSFNMYRSDRGSVFLSQEAIKNFLIEDKVIATSTEINKLTFSFCMGSHEGVMRIARCIYKPECNEAVFFQKSCYGLLAAALATMMPVPYEVYLVDVNGSNGDKIVLKDLERKIRQYPNAKTLFIELKTIAGSVYTSDELTQLVSLCKAYGIFMIADATHVNMEFDKKYSFQDISGICLAFDYHEFAVVYTGSKTYGLERARVGFIILSQFIQSSSHNIIEVEMYRNLGAAFDLPFEVADKLIKSPLELRHSYLVKCAQQLRLNMNLMLAYIEGINSPMLDDDLKQAIRFEINPAYWNGINGLKVSYKPEAGMHMKINTSGLQCKYFSNIRLFNSEIFCYVLNKMFGVVTLHAYCILDPEGNSLRLSFSIKDDIHRGMKAIHHFVKLLADYPCRNRFMPEVMFAENLIFTEQQKNQAPCNHFFESTGYPSVFFRQPFGVINKIDNPLVVAATAKL